MSNLVIVALPAEDDYVWKISSEKVPHMTVLFLGDADQEAEKIRPITEFMQHAIKVANMGPFYMDVDYRGELGIDKADVLFFDKGWDCEIISELRGWLLKDNHIRTLYDAAPQFPDWKPHLTLGYPDSPANEDDRDHPGIHHVRFDRLALWFGDYDGPEFRLKKEYSPHERDVAWSALGEEAVNELLHYGTKGMKWGVRKNRNVPPTASNMERVDARAIEGSTTRAFFRSGKAVYPRLSGSAKWKVRAFGLPAAMSKDVRSQMKEADRQIKVEKADGKWEKTFKSNKEWPRVHNTAADEMDKFLVSHNKKYKDVDFNKPENSSKLKKYEDDYFKEFDKQTGLAAEKVYGQNPSGTKKITYDRKSGLLKLESTSKKVKHAATDEDEVVEEKMLYLIVRDPRTGGIKAAYPVVPDDLDESMEHTFDLDDPEQVMAHIASLGEEFIQHYGVKGMKWGVRKARFQSKLHERRVTAEEATRAKRPAKDVKAYPTIGSSKRKKATIDTKGGEDHPPTEEAIKIAAAKQKYKKSGAAALSNKELKDMEQRLNLENNVDRLMKGNRTTGQKFVDGLLGRGDKNDRKDTTYKIGSSVGRTTAPAAKKVAGKVVRKAVLKV